MKKLLRTAATLFAAAMTAALSAFPIDEMGSETGGVPLDQVTTFRFSIFFTPLLETTTIRLGPIGLSPRVVKNPQTLRIEKVPEDPKEPVPLFSHVIDL